MFFSIVYGQPRMSCYHKRNWPLLCSGPADSQTLACGGVFLLPRGIHESLLPRGNMLRLVGWWGYVAYRSHAG